MNLKKYEVKEDIVFTFRIFLLCLSVCFCVATIGYVTYRINLDVNEKELEEYRDSYHEYFDSYFNLKKEYCKNENNGQYEKYCKF